MGNQTCRVHQERFTNFTDESMKTKGIPLELRKLDSTPFHRKAFSLHAEGFSIIRSSYKCRLLVTSSNPSGLPTFGIPMNPSLRLGWHGRLIEGNNTLLVIPPHGTLDAIINPGFDLFGISCSEELLKENMDALGIGKLHMMLELPQILTCKPEKLRPLQTLLVQTAEKSLSGDVDLSEVKDQVLTKLLDLLSSKAWKKTDLDKKSSRCNAIKETEQYILAHPDEAPKIKDLCEHIGVSKRTLDYAFSDCLGLTPKAYIQAIRLNGVHKKLRTDQTGSLRVSDAANAWGFWHMGQFAKDYRKLFGELPSQTLNTGRSTVQGH